MTKDILFICIHRPDRSPSQRYRIEQFFPYLKENNLSFDYDYLLNANKDAIFYSPGKIVWKAYIALYSVFKLLIISFFKSKNYRFIFVQREAIMLGSAFFEEQMAKRSHLIFDFDDSIWMHHVSDANQKLAFLKNPSKTAEIIKVSKTIIAGNSYLANYARQFNSNVHIIPTCLNTNEYKRNYSFNKKNNGKICIGWSGSLTTVKHFKLAIPFLKKLKEKYGDKIYFKVIGDETYSEQSLNIKGVKWERNTEIRELEEIDIGIMPLPDDEWSKGKCGLKGLVYMSMEIPAVLSNVGFNKEIIKNGVDGFLCDSDNEWITVLSSLIDDSELRQRIGRLGRLKIEDKFSIKTNQQKFIEAIFS